MNARIDILDLKKFLLCSLAVLIWWWPMVFVVQNHHQHEVETMTRMHRLAMQSKHIADYASNLRPNVQYTSAKQAELQHQYDVAAISKSKLSAKDANELVTQLKTTKRIHKHLQRSYDEAQLRLVNNQFEMNQLYSPHTKLSTLIFKAIFSVFMILVWTCLVFVIFIFEYSDIFETDFLDDVL